MSQLVQRSKHKGSNFATLQHKFQTDADVFQDWHCQDVGCSAKEFQFFQLNSVLQKKLLHHLIIAN